MGAPVMDGTQAAVSDKAAGVSVDMEKPMLKQVAKLGDKYDEWTHKPVLGKPIHFDNELLESLVRVPWWLVPLIWVPLTTGFAGAGLAYLGTHRVVEWLTLIVTGLLNWSLLEYSIHRFIFHCKAESEWFIKIHFLHHGAHHKFPLDKGNLVMHPVPSLAIASVLAVIILNTMPWGAGFSFGAGLSGGYIAYDMVHYFVHFGTKLPWFMQNIKRLHMDHHFKDHDVTFGVSTVLMDHVFGTLPPAKTAAKAE
mmetsp:Transcript_29712/g.76791  ORF Transcript_29712/g.76791 Transcript_29712/m.76791 type:complete len:252 (+) Transcript_29712:262-1017(+)